MIRFCAALACLLSLSPSPAPCGTPLFIATTPTAYMPVNAVWRGATLYGTGRPVTVHFVHSIADWGNQLFFMDPRTGASDPLLLYHGGGTRNHCPDSGGLVADLGVRDSSEELVFMMRTISAGTAGRYCTGEACGPRYTGMNDAESRFHSSGEYGHLLGTLWSEMARLQRAAADTLPPPCAGTPRMPPGDSGVLVSFNDGANESFEDLVIFVTGVQMDVERDHIVPDTGKPPGRPQPSACAIEAEAGGVVDGDGFIPRPVALPVSAIRPRASRSEPRYFVDQPWRARYPGRPDETAFPDGPELLVTTPGPFRFDLGFFTNRGEFVNRASGEVTEEMLRFLPLRADGRRTVSLLWYPASDRGERISTGAYVVKGWIKSSPGTAPEPSRCGASEANLLSAFGYIRH
jgi:hypothetical protein